MKKIVYIVEAFGSGVFSFLTDLTSELADSYDITILHGKRGQTPTDFKGCFDERIKFVQIQNFTRGVNPIKDFKAFFEIKQVLKNISPDIVHLNSSKAGGVGRFINYQTNQKVFYSPHGYAFLGDRSVKTRIYFVLETILGKKSVETIACSKSEYEQSEKVTRKSSFVNNAINTQELNCYYNDKSNSKHVFYSIGRISKQKNPALFNDLAQSLPDQKFVWIGDGPLRHELTSPNIEVTGWMSRDKVLEYIQPFDTFLLTSKWEGMPISLLESMYFAKTCLVTNVLGNRDVIKDGINGYLFNNKSEFISKVKNIEQLVSQNARKEVENSYSKERMVNEYIKKYQG